MKNHENSVIAALTEANDALQVKLARATSLNQAYRTNLKAIEGKFSVTEDWIYDLLDSEAAYHYARADNQSNQKTDSLVLITTNKIRTLLGQPLLTLEDML